MSKSLLIVFFAYFFSSSNTETTTVHPSFPYQLDTPNAIFEMPESLKEISGLSLCPDSLHLAAVNDEEGIVFLFDKTTGEIKKEVKFWDDGDYEGLEVVGNDIYVIKSNGTIYQIKNYTSEHPETHKVKSFLCKDNDVEGLAFNPEKNRLLIGCKGKIAEGEGANSTTKKAIYEFDIENMAMLNKPCFLLTLPDIQDYLKHLNKHDHLEKFLKTFAEGEDELKFSPSGIAIHPITNNIYVTSSKGKMLLVLDQKGKILHLEKLKKKIHRQPEGICFDTDGTLYISNEGKDDKAKVYKFLYQN